MVNRKEIGIGLLIAALLVCVWLLVSRLESVNSKGETQFVVDAVRNSAVTCYAVEGAYPGSLDYLREQYGLAYDQTRYFVSYDAFASNLMPEIRVVELEANAS